MCVVAQVWMGFFATFKDDDSTGGGHFDISASVPGQLLTATLSLMFFLEAKTVQMSRQVSSHL